MSLLGYLWQILRLQRDERKTGKERRPFGAWTLDPFVGYCSLAPDLLRKEV